MKNNNLLLKEHFSNNFVIDRNIFVISKDDKYTDNFSNQWKDFNYVQVDSFNKTKISEDYLRELLFNDLNQLKNKNILEIGCGAGRFTEHIVKYSNLCVSIDLSKSIYYNVSKDSKNLILIKSDFLKLKVKKKFDIVICRGVLQHTPDPDKSILKLFDFIDQEGLIFFDYYKKPKIMARLRPKLRMARFEMPHSGPRDRANHPANVLGAPPPSASAAASIFSGSTGSNAAALRDALSMSRYA